MTECRTAPKESLDWTCTTGSKQMSSPRGGGADSAGRGARRAANGKVSWPSRRRGIAQTDNLWQIQVQQQRKEQEEASDLARELPSLFEHQLSVVGDLWHDGTILGVLTGLRCDAALPRSSHTFRAEEAEEVRFTNIESVLARGRCGCRSAWHLDGEARGAVDCITFRGRLGTRLRGGEKRVDVWVVREVTDDGADRAGVKMKSLGDLVSGRGLVKVGTADFIVSRGR